MAQGRPSKSKRKKDLQGTSRKDRERKAKTLPVSSGKLGLPHGLSKTVQRHCSKMAKYLKDSGIPIDLVRPMFERYCKHLQLSTDAHDRYRLKKRVDEKAADYITGRKYAMKDWRDNSDASLKIEKQLETLLRRSKAPEKPELSDLEKFQKKGGKLKVAK